MDHYQESDIVNGLRNGDAEAWRALYDRHAEAVWSLVARRMLPHTADVADVVQETFLAAARSVRSYDPEQGSLINWLTGVARRHVALYYRKEERQDQVCRAAEQLGADSQRVSRWLDNREPAPPDALARQELALLIRATLARLTDDYEQLLMWKYLDGDHVRQIAKRLDQSETSVRSKLARARRAFRAAFSAHMPNSNLTQQGTERS